MYSNPVTLHYFDIKGATCSLSYWDSGDTLVQDMLAWHSSIKWEEDVNQYTNKPNYL